MFRGYFRCEAADAEKEEKNTVNEEESRKFAETAEHWWSLKAFSLLHKMNSVRVPFIRDGILGTRTSSSSPQDEKTEKTLTGISIIDVGCGGGLLSEPLARLGAHVTGLDPVDENIKIAQHHAEMDSEIKDSLEYVCGTVEDYSKGNKKYDAVVCSEVIEHVDNADYFVKSCVKLTKDNGSIFFTTINRTPFSYFYAIFLGEYVFNFIHRGRHEWKKFVKPKELEVMLQSNGCKTVSTRGMMYNWFTKKFYFVSYAGGFYALHAIKESAPPMNGDK